MFKYFCRALPFAILPRAYNFPLDPPAVFKVATLTIIPARSYFKSGMSDHYMDVVVWRMLLKQAGLTNNTHLQGVIWKVIKLEITHFWLLLPHCLFFFIVIPLFIPACIWFFAHTPPWTKKIKILSEPYSNMRFREVRLSDNFYGISFQQHKLWEEWPIRLKCHELKGSWFKPH